jgi:hypothetical protein
MKFKSLLFLLSGLVSVLILTDYLACRSENDLEWPEITSQNKPWTRWWWMGSAVSKDGLSNALEEYSKAGLGGVEITPIYGAKGYEKDYIEYLSDDWVDMLTHTLNEAKRLNLGVDMATGTGWPFGGPWVTSDDACKYMAYVVYELSGGKRLTKPVKYLQKPIDRTISRKVELSQLLRPVSANDSLQQTAFEQIRFEEELPLVLLMAYSDEGKIENLTDKVNKDGILNWSAPAGKWKLYALFQGLHGKLVERAAPGGEGDIIDHFSDKALKHYLTKFDDAFKDHDITTLRGFFNDSYEVDDAIGESDFTPSLFEEFEKRRGYDLRNFLPALFGQDTANKIHIRILDDYRLTISELLLDNFTTTWKEWAHAKGSIVRNQAHGSPGNIIDLYAAADVPETEGSDLLRIKYASSAGNVTGKQLISCEAATWLDEHFKSTLAEAKRNVDQFFLGGVNHIVYHGATYSPTEVPWPGWMFYASVHFAPTNSIWVDLSVLNQYVARCQSFLQSGKPDNDILLYFPFHDRISEPGNSLLEHFSGSGPRDKQTNFRILAKKLIDDGFTLDYISDRQILETNYQENRLHTSGGSYQTIVVPSCNYMPLETYSKLFDLVNEGAIIIFYEKLPEDISGYANYQEKKKTFEQLSNQLIFKPLDKVDMSKAEYGKGAFFKGGDINILLIAAGIYREEMIDQGIDFYRRKNENGKTYFIVNKNDFRFTGYIPLNVQEDYIAIFNPSTGQIGSAHVRKSDLSANQVYVQLESGETCILRTYNKEIKGNKYPYYELKETGFPLNESWKISFISGGPSLPQTQRIDSVIFWTDLEGNDYSYFSGTAVYSTHFAKTENKDAAWLLDLGKVAESASIYLNGKKLVTLISPPFKTIIPSNLLSDSNQLEIHVSNLMANRIIFMERNGMEYRNFYNVNFPAKTSECRGKDGLFTALNWEPFPSGLRGPVTLTPIEYVDF